MKYLMATAAFVGLLMTGTAYAAVTTMSDQQMDTVTAGICNLCDYFLKNVVQTVQMSVPVNTAKAVAAKGISGI